MSPRLRLLIARILILIAFLGAWEAIIRGFAIPRMQAL